MENEHHGLEQDSKFMDKYSRQIGAFGIETMAKLVKLKVLIVGMKGVGVECAKNLILAGPGAVTICDDEPVEMKDLGVNFFLSEEDVGKPRASCITHKLAELNKMVNVSCHQGELTEAVVGKYNIVLFTNTARDQLIRWNEFCRSQSPQIGFLVCDTRGPMGYMFTDYGDRFKTHDASGETPITRIVTDITNEENGIITLLGPDEDGKMHELPDSDHDGWIEISDVDGMRLKDDEKKSINDAGPWRIKFTKKSVQRKGKDGKMETVKVFDPYRLEIGDTRMFTEYTGRGMITQHKKPFEMSFRSFEIALHHPITPGEFGLMFTDGAKFGRAEQLHMAILGLMEFEQRNGRLPNVEDEKDAQEVLECAKSGPEHFEGHEPFKLDELDEKVILTSALYSAVELHPMAAFFGGVVAQEIVKFTGKFTPVRQWMHFDAFEILPSKDDDLTATKDRNTDPLNSRYDHMISIYGRDFQNLLGSVRTFLVGCGALGCEYLKNFAMIGLACGEKGCVTVTDNDRIEVSNLNRQFLFREHNVGQPKSVAATNAVKLMNEELKVKALEHLVAPTTEHIFNDDFWNSLDVVTNALDNVKARTYVDSRCVFFKKPLLESGTLGTKCNVQVIVPHLTQSYSDGPKDADDDNIPMCTLRNFPSLIEHCIEWSRAQFEDLFVVPFRDAKNFTDNPNAFITELKKATIDHPNQRIGASAMMKELERIRHLHQTLQNGSGLSFEDCIAKAFNLLHTSFRDRILQLVHNFPADHVTSSGEKFWTGAKRFPSAATFDPKDELHMAFLIATANLFAVGYGLSPLPEDEVVAPDSKYRDPKYFEQVIAQLPVPKWTPTDEKIAEDEDARKKMEEAKQKEAEESNEAEVSQFVGLVNELQQLDTSKFNFQPADFEKDQDLNFHIDFIYSASNLRATNYQIPNASRHKCKMIAGKIIPAIATTTASVTGLAMLEMLKILQKKPLESYKDSSNSLGLNLYLSQEPAPPEKAKDEYDVIEMSEVKCKPSGFTKWDSTIINAGDLTLEGFLNAFKDKTDLNCDLLFHKIAELDDEKYKGVSGLMLYDRNAYQQSLKQLYQDNLSKRLIEWIDERYQSLVDTTTCSYIELQTSCTDDEGNAYKIPTVVYRFRE